MLNNILGIALLFISQIAISQNIVKCNTSFLVNQSITEDSRNYQAMEEVANKNNQWITENELSSKSVITIPIVVHIVHRQTHANIGSGTNISNEQIEDAIRILNEDFSKTNSEFPNPPRNTFINLAADVQLQFCLAATDENGNTTSGVTRTSSTKTNFDAGTESNDMKKNNTGGKDGWDPEEYLNIWVCDLTNQGSGMTLGYAYLPGSVAWSMWKDGLVVDYRYFGTIGLSAPGNDGKTTTHEIGHYLGLMHTFCEETDAQGNPICCDNDDTNWGGYVDDTPATKDIYFGNVNSSTNNNTCNDISYSNNFTTNVLDMDENFMSYASDTWMFTTEQSGVMNGTMNGYRSSLKNSPAAVNCSGIINGFNNLLDNNQIRIYPNPTEGRIMIQNLTPLKSEEIIVRNILGEVVYIQKSKSNLTTLNISNLENGIYFVEIYTENGMRIEKIILSK